MDEGTTNNNTTGSTSTGVNNNETQTGAVTETNNKKDDVSGIINAAIEENNKKWQSKFDKVNTEKITAMKKLDDLEKEKLTDEEKRELEKRKKNRELKLKEREINRKELTLQTVELLNAEGLDINFAPYIMGKTIDEVKQKLESFKKLWGESVKKSTENVFKDNGRSVTTGKETPPVTTGGDKLKDRLHDF